jgi:hypothetical protein
MRCSWLLIATLACARRETAESVKLDPEIAATQPLQVPTPVDDVGVATRWLEALRDGGHRDLAALTRYPFELHEDGGGCADQTAPNAEALHTAIACLANDASLIELLRSPESSTVEPLADVHLPAWAKKWHVTTTPSRIVTAEFSRNDSRAEFDLSIVDGGVRGVWKSGVDGSWAIKLATDWIEAVRTRDLERLARVTAYPFELRDSGRDAGCGRRLVKARADLAKAVDCLFRSDQLHRAMTDTAASGFVAYEADSPLANWIEPWWRENEHNGLQRVMTMVATTEGYEYDFQLLMGRDGIRVAWKLGAFEARD